eukprot:9850500-Lingulodinium_polyedra.AAC.1
MERIRELCMQRVSVRRRAAQRRPSWTNPFQNPCRFVEPTRVLQFGRSCRHRWAAGIERVWSWLAPWWWPARSVVHVQPGTMAGDG